jgi:hypothetical protein
MRQLSSEMLQFFIHVHFFLSTYDLPSEVFCQFYQTFHVKKSDVEIFTENKRQEKNLMQSMCYICDTCIFSCSHINSFGNCITRCNALNGVMARSKKRKHMKQLLYFFLFWQRFAEIGSSLCPSPYFHFVLIFHEVYSKISSSQILFLSLTTWNGTGKKPSHASVL